MFLPQSLSCITTDKPVAHAVKNKALYDTNIQTPIGLLYGTVYLFPQRFPLIDVNRRYQRLANSL